MLIGPVFTSSFQGDLQAFVAIRSFLYYNRVCPIPETVMAFKFLVLTVPQHYLCVTNCCCEEHSE